MLAGSSGRSAVPLAAQGAFAALEDAKEASTARHRHARLR